VPDNTLCQILPITDSIFSASDCFLFSPPNPIRKFFYKCDRKFYLEDLLKLYEVCDNYAIVLISGKKVELYLYSENQTKFLKTINESLPNQHKTGGQSAQRFERIRDEKIGWFASKITEVMIQYYVTEGKFKYKGIIIAGPAEMKNFVKEEELFIKFFDKYLLKTITISEITDQSIHQVINMSLDVLSSESSQKNLFKNFENMMSDPKQIDIIVFGTEQSLTAFESGQLKEILVFEKYHGKEQILKSESKTKIHIIKNNDFVSAYGEVVGIRYYSEYIDYDYDDEDDN
jgi:peptide chain release factor subunit 1